MLVHLRDGSAKAVLRAATLEREVGDQSFYLAFLAYLLFKPLVYSDRRQRGSIPVPPALEVNALPRGH